MKEQIKNLIDVVEVKLEDIYSEISKDPYNISYKKDKEAIALLDFLADLVDRYNLEK